MDLKTDTVSRDISFGINYIKSKNVAKETGAATLVGAAFIGSSIAKTAQKVQSLDLKSIEELIGRAKALVDANEKTSETKDFNQQISYSYFANGKLRYIDEYVKTGREKVAEMSEQDKKNRLNTLFYQRAIVDKIINDRSLVRNQSVRDNMWFLVTLDNDASLEDYNGNIREFHKQYQQKTDARIKVLDRYARDEELRQNNIINDFIGWFVSDIQNDEQAELLISLLKNNIENNDIYYFINLDELLKNNINTDLIRKVQSDKKIYDNINPCTLYNIGGNAEETAEDIIKIIDKYQKDYPYSEKIPENINDILVKSFSKDQTENPVDVAYKMMADIGNEEGVADSDSALALVMNINVKLDDIFEGKFYDKSKSDLDNATDAMDMIRDLRTELQNNLPKYTSPYEKQLLWQMMQKIILCINFMKDVRSEHGFPTFCYSDFEDREVNAKIMKVLEKM